MHFWSLTAPCADSLSFYVKEQHEHFSKLLLLSSFENNIYTFYPERNTFHIWKVQSPGSYLKDRLIKMCTAHRNLLKDASWVECVVIHTVLHLVLFLPRTQSSYTRTRLNSSFMTAQTSLQPTNFILPRQILLHIILYIALGP